MCILFPKIDLLQFTLRPRMSDAAVTTENCGQPNLYYTNADAAVMIYFQQILLSE